MVKHTCRVCGNEHLYKALDLGVMPSANDLVEKRYLSKVKSYPLRYYWCGNCTFFQQVDLVDRKRLFGGNYVYFTGASHPAVEHFKELSLEMGRRLYNKSFAVVIASNDGTEIKLLREFGGFEKVLGVEPTKNLAKIANKNGLPTINAFFGEELSRRMADDCGKADLVIANNVFAHIPDPQDMLRGMGNLISDDGIISIEVHWLKKLIEELQIDALYAEHYYVWDIKAFERISENCGLKIAGIEYLPNRLGGSIRVMMKKHGKSHIARRFILEEERVGLYDIGEIKKLQKRSNERRDRFARLIKGLKKQNRSVSIWTVPAKIATWLNFCGISSNEIDYGYDATEYKIGRYIPNANILVKDERKIEEDMPDYLIVGAWNYMDFGRQKLRWYLEKGGKLINPLTCEIVGGK